jgi:glycerophosphoryl diester phosphodiesterase
MPSRPNRFRVRESRPWVIAHRGDSAHRPENTLEAARRAHERGADAWEFDVQLTRDAVPIVIHDETLARTTDVGRRFASDPRGRVGFRVADFDLAEIRCLDAGSWFLGPASTPRSAAAFGNAERLDEVTRRICGSGRVRVPTLLEALELTARLDWAANVELKSRPDGPPGLLDATLAVIAATGTADRVLVSSFDHAEVARAARQHSEVATGVLVATPIDRPGRYCRDWIGADAYHPSVAALGAGSDADGPGPSPAGLRSEDLEDLRAAGVACFVYTVNDAADGGLADQLAAAGVAGLFTDDPAPLIARWRPAADPGQTGSPRATPR